MDSINLAFNTELLAHGKLEIVQWPYKSHPHLGIIADTGMGKSHLIRHIIGSVTTHVSSSRTYLLDFKDDYRALLGGKSRYFGYRNCMAGFDQIYDEFQNRLQGSNDRSFVLAVFDEYLSFLAHLPKPEAEDVRKRMAELLFMSRSFNFHIILGCQRALAENFAYGSRDSLSIIFLGSPSKESIRSFCSSEESEQMKSCGIGVGYACFGRKPTGITVANVRNINKLESAIIQAVTR
jgi:uncharacterized protein YozE (UPF0346 family)